MEKYETKPAMKHLISFWSLVVLASVLLSGCVNAQMQQMPSPAQLQQHQQAQDACQMRLPKQIGNMVARANCLTSADETYLIPFSANPDLWRVYDAFRLSVSAEIDRGEISLEDGSLAIAKKNSEIVQTITDRRAAAATVNAQNRAANAAVLSAILNNMNQPRGYNIPDPTPPPMPHQLQTQCWMPFGPSGAINCETN